MFERIKMNFHTSSPGNFLPLCDVHVLEIEIPQKGNELIKNLFYLKNFSHCHSI